MSDTMSDPRTGPSESGFVTITDGDGNAPQTAVNIPADALFKVEAIKIEYDPSGTGDDVEIGVFDDADGTGAGAVGDQRDSFKNIDPGEEVMADNLSMRDFEEDVLVQSIGDNHDADVDVTVYGTILIALADETGR